MSTEERRDPHPHTRWGIRRAGSNEWLGEHGIWGPVNHARLWGGLRECTEAVGVLLENQNEVVMEHVTIWAPVVKE